MAGSLGYAERLKNRKRLGGQLGATEYMEDVQTVKDKVQQLAGMVAAAKNVFLFTGAGISTSAGIPDFRGPTGIWTLKKKKQPINAPLTPFEHAKPTLTHMVIAALVCSGKGSYVCSQNVDSLHLRSGVPRHKLAELHGNCFAERCSTCRHERVRDFQVETLNFKPTGRKCSRAGCGGVMVDNVLDWDSALPEDELDASLQAAQAADVCLVLGSSLQIQPANEVPLHTADAKGKLVIVNLQKTPRDRSAALILRARVDVVMARLALQLALPIPPFVRLDGVAVCHQVMPGNIPNSVNSAQQESKAGQSTTEGSWSFQLTVRSVQGHTCIMPMVQAVTVRVDAEPAAGDASAAMQVAVVSVGNALAAQQQQQQKQGKNSGQPGEAPNNGASNGAEGDVHHHAPLSVQAASTMLPSQQQQQQPPCDGSASSSCCATAATSAVQGGVPTGGPYEFIVSNIPPSMQQVACHVQLHLVEWADPDKREVSLPVYHVMHASAAGVPADTTTGANNDIKQELQHNITTAQDAAVDSAHSAAGQLQQQPAAHAADSMAMLDVQVAAALDAAGVALPCQADAATLQALNLTPPDQVKLEAQGGTPDVPVQVVQQEGIDDTQHQGVAEMGRAQEPAEPVQPGKVQLASSRDNKGLNASGKLFSGSHPTVLAQTPQLAIYTFITQVVKYDAAEVWRAFETSPPPVVLPAQKKQKVTPDRSGSEAGDGMPLRRSGRRMNPTARAAGNDDDDDVLTMDQEDEEDCVLDN